MDKKMYVGVMGFSGKKFDTELAQVYLEQAFNQVESVANGRRISIVSGYTDLGIPAMAYREAAKRGWETVGIACAKAQDYDVYPCDEVEIVGSNWGEESPTFIAKCEMFVRVGGGAQSFDEVKAARSAKKDVIEYDLEELPA